MLLQTHQDLEKKGADIECAKVQLPTNTHQEHVRKEHEDTRKNPD